jgi:hypothetical protein
VGGKPSIAKPAVIISVSSLYPQPCQDHNSPGCAVLRNETMLYRAVEHAAEIGRACG